MTETANLIEQAYAMQKEVDTWLPRLQQTGELDEDSLARMAQIRLNILTADPVSEMDRLMQFGAVRSVASFIYSMATSEPEDAVAILTLIENSATEILIGLDKLRSKYETEANATLEDLGLFTDRNALQ